MNIVSNNTFLRDRREITDRLERWQVVVNQVAESYEASASLICQLTSTGIRPVVSSEQESNPFSVDLTFSLEDHTFCKAVIFSKKFVYVGNAAREPEWSVSPIWTEFGFCSYYGLPLRWPDEEIFGSICVMDRAATDYQEPFMSWLSCLRDLVESDLALVTHRLSRSRYLSDISQELKSSVANILGRTDSLMSSALSEKQQEDIGDIQASAEALVCVLNDVVEIARADVARLGPAGGAGAEIPPRALIVEDNQINQRVAGALLEPLGFDVEFADDGVEAVDRVQSKRFDIILMDVQMPRMDGLDATRQIRALEGWRASVPIIAVTANAMVSDKYKCIEAGMNDLLPKPIEPDRLTELIKNYLVTKSS